MTSQEREELHQEFLDAGYSDGQAFYMVANIEQDILLADEEYLLSQVENCGK